MAQYVYTFGLAGERTSVTELDRTVQYSYDELYRLVSETVIDENGTVTDTYTFDAWGNLTASTGDTVNTYLYCGEQFDSTTGLYYLRARYVNPSTGTFISMDVYQGSIFDPISLHKYLYANVNPVMNCDPSGYDSVRELATATAGQGYISESRAKHDKTVMRIGLSIIREMVPMILSWMNLNAQLIDGILNGGPTSSETGTSSKSNPTTSDKVIMYNFNTTSNNCIKINNKKPA